MHFPPYSPIAQMRKVKACSIVLLHTAKNTVSQTPLRYGWQRQLLSVPIGQANHRGRQDSELFNDLIKSIKYF
jgi:hypothetical protein